MGFQSLTSKFALCYLYEENSSLQSVLEPDLTSCHVKTMVDHCFVQKVCCLFFLTLARYPETHKGRENESGTAKFPRKWQ